MNLPLEVTPTRIQTTADLTSLWPEIAPGMWMSRGVVYRYADGTEGRSISGGPLRSPDETARAVQWANQQNASFYVSVNPCRPNGVKARRQDVTRWSHILIDLDPQNLDFGPPLDPAPPLVDGPLVAYTPDRIDHWIQYLFRVPDACHVLDSGRGLQFWLRIEDGEVAPKKSLTDLEHVVLIERATNHFLHHTKRELALHTIGYDLDTSTSDLPRVGRCPGNVNPKTGRRATLKRLATGAVPAQKILEWYLRDNTPRVDHGNRPPLPSNLSSVLPHLTPTARDFLTLGAESPGRHRTAFHTAKSLLEAGLEKGVVAEWMTAAATRCRPPLPSSDALHAVETASRCSR